MKKNSLNENLEAKDEEIYYLQKIIEKNDKF